MIILRRSLCNLQQREALCGSALSGLVCGRAARLAQQLYNNDPRNLAALEEHLRVRATSRDGWIKLEGAREDVERARQLFQLLEASLKGGSPVRDREFSHALNVVKHEGALALKNLLAERILTSAKKAAVTPRTTGQKRYVEAIRRHDVTLGIGPAGTGKTYLAMAQAVAFLVAKKVSRIILARPAVEAGEKLGFLPGDMQEKVNPYLRPLYDALYDMLDTERVARYIERGTIEIAPIAFMRGRTLNDSFVILDEAQNTTSEQMKMFLTRLGFGAKAVITGDITQIDLPIGRTSGLVEAMKVVGSIEGISFIHFDDRDVVRHKLVQQIVKAYEKFSNGNGRAS
jgi:phosphate starvation-inducible PhoH-like protein